MDRPGEDGVVVQEDTPDAWADAVGQLLNDQDRAARMGASARARVERAYLGWDEVLDRLLKPVWLDVAGAGQQPAPCSGKSQQTAYPG